MWDKMQIYDVNGGINVIWLFVMICLLNLYFKDSWQILRALKILCRIKNIYRLSYKYWHHFTMSKEIIECLILCCPFFP